MLSFMIWGSCVLVEVILAVMGALFVYKAKLEEDQEGTDAINDDQVRLFCLTYMHYFVIFC